VKAQKQTTKRDLLKKVPLFSNLSKGNLDEIAKIADETEVSAGKAIAKEGETGLEFVFILEGQAKVEKHGKVVNRLAPHDFFGEVAIIDGRPRTATVTAETDMKLLVVESRYFARLLEKTPGLLNEIMVALCKYIRDAG
jgi:CRP/FNR family cyclic AMP-dependent transcriptional regulator